jgi:hypothetical protein
MLARETPDRARRKTDVYDVSDGMTTAIMCGLHRPALPAAVAARTSSGAGQEPAPRSLSPGNLFGLICFQSNGRLSGRVEEERLSSKWGYSLAGCSKTFVNLHARRSEESRSANKRNLRHSSSSAKQNGGLLGMKG